MFHRRLIEAVPASRRAIGKTVILMWVGLLANSLVIGLICYWGQLGIDGQRQFRMDFLLLILGGVAVRFLSTYYSAASRWRSGSQGKQILRQRLYDKILRMGYTYQEHVSTAGLLQLASEGIEQLEIYFGQYLPQFFYSLLATLSLFVILATIDWRTALILLICIPLIPLTIVAVQKVAKRLLGSYWKSYTHLADHFMENSEGLTTLKIYGADEYRHEQMNRDAEHFRKVTMRVLTMQLNSIAVMDIIAYGGAAAGIIVSSLALQAGRLLPGQALFIILMAAEFFIPLRRLGSFFHVAMNGMAAADRLFEVLDLPETQTSERLTDEWRIFSAKRLTYAYQSNQPVLDAVEFTIKRGEFVAFVGKSGSGKSTIVKIILGALRDYQGTVKVNDCELKETSNLLEQMTLVEQGSYLFKGSVCDNLLMAKPQASQEDMIEVLKKVDLFDFFRDKQGLSTLLEEQAANLSGGQRQRLALARALLRDSAVYVFDEATSNIDSDSEKTIVRLIRELVNVNKTIIMISHRLANVVKADTIFVMDKGCLVESGNHQQLLNNHSVYAKLYHQQSELEAYSEGGVL